MENLNDPRPISQRLREENWDLHQSAENAALPRHLAKGTIPKEAYVGYLSQMLHLSRALDEALRSARESTPLLEAVVADEQFKTEQIEADLRHWGANPDSTQPGPAVQKLVDQVKRYAAEDPIRLFGFHYVREGSTNGNRFIALKLRAVWDLPEQREGFMYLDPYGLGQRPLWERFKRDLDKQALSEEEKVAVIEAAREIFQGFIDMHGEFDLPALPDEQPVNAAARA